MRKDQCAYNILLNLWRNQDHYMFQRRSRSVSERRRWRIRPILGLDVNGTLSIYLAGVKLVKLCEMLEKAYTPSLEAFYTHVISTPSLHRASTDALII